MDCKKIQDLIITDYIDARMGAKPKGLIDLHLAHCHACEDFLISIKNEVVNPLNNARKFVPDESLWAQIKQTIDQEQEQQAEVRFIPDFWERSRAVVFIPRPVFAFATVVMLIFMVGIPSQLAVNTPRVKIDGQGQVEYISSLIDGSVDVAGNIGADAQTPIERYFL